MSKSKSKFIGNNQFSGLSYGYGLWTVVCHQCGEERKLKAHKYKNGKVRGEEKVCQPCRGKNLAKRVLVSCPSCGSIRELRESDAKQRLSNYCKGCSKGLGKPKNKNGKHVNRTSRGYVMVIGMKDHPLANKSRQIHEHWLVLYEQHPMGQEAVLWFKRNNFTIHHKNGIRDDNCLENLELRAPGNHPHGWSIDDMRDVVLKYDGLQKSQNTGVV